MTQDLKTLRELCDAATDGEWHFTNGKVPRIMTKDQLSIAGIHKRGALEFIRDNTDETLANNVAFKALKGTGHE